MEKLTTVFVIFFISTIGLRVIRTLSILGEELLVKLDTDVRTIGNIVLDHHGLATVVLGRYVYICWVLFLEYVYKGRGKCGMGEGVGRFPVQ